MGNDRFRHAPARRGCDRDRAAHPITRGERAAAHAAIGGVAWSDDGAVIADTAVPPHLDEAFDITQRYWVRRDLSGPEADDLLWDRDRFRRRQLVFSSTVDIVVCPVTSGVASAAANRRP